MKKDLRKMGVRRWRKRAENREDWAIIVKETLVKLKRAACQKKKRNMTVFPGMETRPLTSREATVAKFRDVKQHKLFLWYIIALNCNILVVNTMNVF